jgi:hypothetical protein
LSTRHLIRLLVIVITLHAFPAVAENTLATAVYTGNFSFLTITAERKLVHNQDTLYTFSQETDNFMGSIIEQSQFHLNPDRSLTPYRYLYRQKILGKTKAYEMHFDWEKMQARYLHDGEQQIIALEKGLLDPLLYQLQLQKDARNNRETLSYRFLKKNKIKHYTFQRAGEESITFNNQENKTLKIHRVPADDKRETLIWLSPEHLYQIARIVHTENGESNSLVIKSAESSPEFQNWLSH